MYNPNDDIDRLSREAAEHYNAPGSPLWDAMRATLDKELPQEKEKKRRGFLFFLLLAAGLFVAGTAIWYGVRTNNKTIAAINKPAEQKNGNLKNEIKPTEENNTVATNNKSINKTDKPTSNQPDAKEKNIDAGAQTSTGSNDGNNAAEKLKANKPADNKNTIAQILPVATPASKKLTALKSVDEKSQPKIVRKQRDVQIFTKTNKITGTDITLAAAKKTSAAKNHHIAFEPQNVNNTALPDAYVAGKKNKTHKPLSDRSVKNKTVAQHQPEAMAGSIAQNSSADDGRENTGSDNNSTEPVTPRIADTSDNNDVALTAPDATTNKIIAGKDSAIDKLVDKTQSKDSVNTAAGKTKAKSKTDKAILLGITGGLDWSTVKFNYGSKLGYNIGFMGGYQFSKHWAVYTGIVYTKKNYKLNGGDYHPPKDYWTRSPNVDLQTVAGYCRMWELPVEARYTFNPSAKTAFFASAGLSSYFMKSQEYTYAYKTNGWTDTASWHDGQNINHIFSILDLSAGFTKPIGKFMNWQVEPYAKIPLGGVGFGNIKLSSFGINLTVQYKHPVKR